MNTEWEIHEEVIYEQQSQIEAGGLISTYVFDHETYERKYVKAIISKAPEKLSEAERLWVRDLKGKLLQQPWAIKIVKEEPPPWETGSV